MTCGNCNYYVPENTNVCTVCGRKIYNHKYWSKIFKKPPLINGSIFPELNIKYLNCIKPSEVCYIEYYYRKYHYGEFNKNKNFNNFCETIEMLKYNSEKDIEKFYNVLKDVFHNDDYVIITIPSHDPNVVKTGIKSLAKLIILNNNLIIDGTDYLKRTKLINKHGHNRTKNEQYNSMKLESNISLENKIILLFDDIYTTGNTINSAMRIIEKENPKYIGKLTLAKTFKKEL